MTPAIKQVLFKPSFIKELNNDYKDYITRQGVNGVKSQQEIVKRNLLPLYRLKINRKLQELAFFSGANLTGAVQKIIKGTGAPSFLTVAGTPTYNDASGIHFNGSTDWLITGLAQNANGMILSDYSMGAFSSDDSLSNGTSIGAGGNYYNRLSKQYSGVFGGQSGIVDPVDGGDWLYTTSGFSAVNCINGLVNNWQGQLKIGEIAQNFAQSISSEQFYIGALTNNFGQLNGYIDGYYISKGLTDYEVSILSEFFTKTASELGRFNTNRIVYLGDSIPNGSGASSHNNCYAALTAAALGMTELNNAIPGKTVVEQTPSTNPGSWCRASIVNCQLSGRIINSIFSGKYWVFHCGMNDVNFNLSTSQAISNIDTIIQTLINYGIPKSNIILGNITYSTYVNYNEGRAQTINAGILNIAQNKGVRHVDFYTVSKNTSGFLSVDSIHPSDTGHAALSQALLSAING